MNTNTTELSPPIELTERAVERIRTLIEEEDKDGVKLRIYVSGGGCAGFQYGFAFTEEQGEDDTAIERDGVSVLIDIMSRQYLSGATIDFLDELDGSRFVIENPNATTRCGCGSSFSA